MEDFYAKIPAFKKDYKQTNKMLGKLIDKEEPAFRQALSRKTLSNLEIQRLEKHIEQVKNTSNKKEQSETDNDPERLDDDTVVNYVIEHSDRLREANSKFNMFCELLEVKAERELMRKLRE